MCRGRSDRRCEGPDGSFLPECYFVMQLIDFRCNIMRRSLSSHIIIYVYIRIVVSIIVPHVNAYTFGFSISAGLPERYLRCVDEG